MLRTEREQRILELTVSVGQRGVPEAHENICNYIGCQSWDRSWIWLDELFLTLKGFIYQMHGGGVRGEPCDFLYLPDHHVGYAVMIYSGREDAFHRITNLIREFQTKDFREKKITRYSNTRVPCQY